MSYPLAREHKMASPKKNEPKNISEIKSLLRTAETLTEALPYLGFAKILKVCLTLYARV